MKTLFKKFLDDEIEDAADTAALVAAGLLTTLLTEDVDEPYLAFTAAGRALALEFA